MSRPYVLTLPNSHWMPRLALILCVCLLFTGNIVNAQEEEAMANPPAAPDPHASLANALKNLDWDPQRRGPLLVVIPPPRFPGEERKEEDPEDEPAPTSSRPTLAQLAPLFRHRIIRLSGLTALVPMEMPTLPASLQPEMSGPAMELDGRENILPRLRLLSTLTEDQWRLAGSATGLGRNDLTGQQIALFDHLISARMMLVDSRDEEDSKMDDGAPVDSPPRAVSPPRQPVSTAVRLGIRIHVVRRYKVTAIQAGSKIPVPLVETVLWPESEPHRFSLSANQDLPEDNSLPPINSNRLKPGQMDLESKLFDSIIPLNDVGTIGALVERIRTATRVEVSVDARISTLPLFVRGESAPASALLKAICWGIGGTFRRLQSGNRIFFLLTEDVQGIAPRLARLTENDMDQTTPTNVGIAENNSAIRRLGNRIFAMKPMRFIKSGHALFRPLSNNENPDTTPSLIEFIPSSELANRLFRPDLSGRHWDGSGMVVAPVDMLPEPVRNLFQTSAIQANRSLEENPEARERVDLNRVQIGVDVLIELRHPQLGLLAEFDLPTVGPPLALPKPDDLAIPFNTRGIRLAIATPDQARTAVAALRARGFNQCWLHLPVGLSEVLERETIQAAVTAGADGARVAIIPVVPLLSRPLPDTPDGFSDMTSDGRSAAAWAKERSKSPALLSRPLSQAEIARQPDWLLPDSPPAITRVAQIQRLAQIPGITGLAIRHAAPPFLFASIANPMARHYDRRLYADVGFSPGLRTEFLLRHQVDVIDFPVPSTYGVKAFREAPFLRMLEMNGRMAPSSIAFALFSQWIQERQKTNGALLTQLHMALNKARPGLALYLPNFVSANSSLSEEYGAQWSSWDVAEQYPDLESTEAASDEEETTSPALAVQNHSRSVVCVLNFDAFLMQYQAEFSEWSTPSSPETRRLIFVSYIAEQTKLLRKRKTQGHIDSVCVDLASQPLDTALDLITIWPTVHQTTDKPTTP